MILTKCFTKEWIDEFRSQKQYNKINPPLLEKMIHALSLLQFLNKAGLDLIFKGGTSLILLLEDSNRFSVDIDIMTEENKETVERVLDQVIQDSHFKGWKLDEKRSYKPGVPKAHYELEYDSNVNKGSNYVLLDILFEKAHYSSLQKLPIQSIWVETVELLEITLPTVEAISGDKLTAFAPTTTGILYGKGKELEIIKQLFDLGNLFNRIETVEHVSTTFNAFAAQEIAYRNLTATRADILNDTLNTCRIISLRERNREEQDKLKFNELQTGIRSFGNYLISGNFRIDEAVLASSKVAYLCSKLLLNDHSPIEKYKSQDIESWEITNPEWNVLNKLKRFRDQSAFFYWYKALEKLGNLK
jgi:hypothetical protein